MPQYNHFELNSQSFIGGIKMDLIPVVLKGLTFIIPPCYKAGILLVSIDMTSRSWHNFACLHRDYGAEWGTTTRAYFWGLGEESNHMA